MRRKAIAIYIMIIAGLTLFITQQIESSPFFSMSNFYIEQAFEQLQAINAVASVYLYFRYYDTLFEALMLLFSIIAVIYMSVHDEGEEYDQ